MLTVAGASTTARCSIVTSVPSRFRQVGAEVERPVVFGQLVGAVVVENGERPDGACGTSMQAEHLPELEVVAVIDENRDSTCLLSTSLGPGSSPEAFAELPASGRDVDRP
jgi:hypothetical protein